MAKAPLALLIEQKKPKFQQKFKVFYPAGKGGSDFDEMFLMGGHFLPDPILDFP